MLSLSLDYSEENLFKSFMSKKNLHVENVDNKLLSTLTFYDKNNWL